MFKIHHVPRLAESTRKLNKPFTQLDSKVSLHQTYFSTLHLNPSQRFLQDFLRRFFMCTFLYIFFYSFSRSFLARKLLSRVSESAPTAFDGIREGYEKRAADWYFARRFSARSEKRSLLERVAQGQL